MLKGDPDLRLSATEALHDVWLKQKRDFVETPKGYPLSPSGKEDCRTLVEPITPEMGKQRSGGLPLEKHQTSRDLLKLTLGRNLIS